jgi:hypothetical protein
LVAAEVEDRVPVLVDPVDSDRESVRTEGHHHFLSIRWSEDELRSRAALGHHAGTIEAATVRFVELGSDVRVTCVTFDCADPGKVAGFWAQALRWELVGHTVRPPDQQPYLEFCPVAEPKAVKNRLHLGLNAGDRLDEEVERLIGLGATFAWEEEFPEGWTYRNIVLRDVEGNEFCIGSGG